MLLNDLNTLLKGAKLWLPRLTQANADAAGNLRISSKEWAVAETADAKKKPPSHISKLCHISDVRSPSPCLSRESMRHRIAPCLLPNKGHCESIVRPLAALRSTRCLGVALSTLRRSCRRQ